MRLVDLLDLDRLGLTLVAGRDHLDREIRWPYTTDLLDPRRYLSGGELVLTSTLWRHMPADSDTFVAALVSRRVAGLVAGHDVHGPMPEDLADACRRRSLPLFDLPKDLSFGTISEIVIGAIMVERDATLARSLHRHHRLLSALAGGDGVPEILDALAGDLPTELWLLSETGRVLASTVSSAPPKELQQIWHEALTAHAFPATVCIARERRWSVFPIGAELGEFLVGAGDYHDWTEELLVTVSEIAQFVAIARTQVRERRVVERALAGALVCALATTSTTLEELNARLEACGLDATDPMLVITAAASEPNGKVPEMVIALLADAVAAARARSAISTCERETVAVVAAGDTDGDSLEHHLRESARWCETGFGEARVAIGVSGVVTNIVELHGALLEAGHARALASIRAERIAIATSGELNSHMLLMATTSERVRLVFHQRLIGPLLEHDRTHRGELVVTLAAFLDEAGGWMRCAARLHIHVNTLRYRIQRIEELTGRSMGSMETRVDFYLALRAADPGAATAVRAVLQSRE